MFGPKGKAQWGGSRWYGTRAAIKNVAKMRASLDLME